MLDRVRGLWLRPYSRPLLVFLLAVNAIGAVFGYHWYAWQLSQLPLYTWPVVFDSPFAVTGVALVAWLRLRGRAVAWLELWAALAVIKYGAWAALLWLASWSTGTPVLAFDFFGLFLTHIGMILEGSVLLRHIPPLPAAQRAAVALWFFANDYFDYVHGLHPTLPPRLFGWCAATAVALSSLGALLAWRTAREDGR